MFWCFVGERRQLFSIPGFCILCSLRCRDHVEPSKQREREQRRGAHGAQTIGIRSIAFTISFDGHCFTRDRFRPFFRAFSLSISLSLFIIPLKRPYLIGEQCRRTSRRKYISIIIWIWKLFRELCFDVFLAIIISNISIWSL